MLVIISWKKIYPFNLLDRKGAKESSFLEISSRISAIFIVKRERTVALLSLLSRRSSYFQVVRLDGRSVSDSRDTCIVKIEERLGYILTRCVL